MQADPVRRGLTPSGRAKWPRDLAGVLEDQKL